MTLFRDWGSGFHTHSSVCATGLFLPALTRSSAFSLVDPIPDADPWLRSLKEGFGFVEGEWETWVWRLTDIDLGDAVKVYARGEDEVQFFVDGCGGLSLVGVDFREPYKKVGDACFGGGGEHLLRLSPSGRYIVCLAQNPRSYVSSGVALDCTAKQSGAWAAFEGDTARWWKREDAEERPGSG